MKLIPLTQGAFTKVDDADYPELSKYKWHLWRSKNRTTQYAMRSGKDANGLRCTVWMHRVILNTPWGMEGDHINGDGLDNQRHNLRSVTRAQNAVNCRKRKGTRSKYKGVYLEGPAITAQFRKECLGRFLTEMDAARAYDVAARKKYGEYASLNFPNESSSPPKPVTFRLPRTDNASGHRGVSLHKASGLWKARITRGGKTVLYTYHRIKDNAIQAVEDFWTQEDAAAYM